GRLHVTHVSAAESVDLLGGWKRRGVRVTADRRPPPPALPGEDLVSYDPNLKVNPPMRSADDRDALRDGLAEGVLDAVATDHAPHAEEDKEQEFDQSPPGPIGLETALAFVLTELVGPGLLTMSAAVERMSTTPASILGLDDHGGPIAPGRVANLVVFEP